MNSAINEQNLTTKEKQARIPLLTDLESEIESMMGACNPQDMITDISL